MPQAATCPECGAPVSDGLDCETRFHWLLAQEAQDPELYALHFYNVALYNLQHPAQFTDEAQDGLKTLFLQAWKEHWPQPKILKAARAANMGEGKVIRPEAEREPVLRPWTMTIADVWLPDRPEDVVTRVRAWAQAIFAELKA